MKKSVFKITDMHCTSCAINIDFELEDLDGVKSAKTNYARGQSEVEYDPEKLNEQKIIDAIKKAGYTSTPVVVN